MIHNLINSPIPGGREGEFNSISYGLVCKVSYTPNTMHCTV